MQCKKLLLFFILKFSLSYKMWVLLLRMVVHPINYAELPKL